MIVGLEHLLVHSGRDLKKLPCVILKDTEVLIHYVLVQVLMVGMR